MSKENSVPKPKLRELKAFDTSLSTNSPRTVSVFRGLNTTRMKVRPLGHISPEQFKEMTSPAYFDTSWDELSDDMLERDVKYKMEDLRNSVKEQGVVRPVVLSQKSTSDDFTKGKHIVVDGNHRAAAALHSGKNIPTYVLHEDETWNWY